jgi:hypothetical protein
MTCFLLTCWGIRYDPSGFIVEHYVDGDQVNCHSKTNIELATPDGLHVWGESSLMFGDRKLTGLGPRLPDGFLT